MTDSWLFFTILYNVMCAFVTDTYGLFSSSLSIRVHQTFGLKISHIYDIFFFGQQVISDEWQMTTSWTKEAGGFFLYEALLFISPLSFHWQNINMHVQNYCRLNLSKLGDEEHCCLQVCCSWTEGFSLEGFFVTVKQWSFRFVIEREMNMALARKGQCAVNVICLVSNTVAVNNFFLV